MKSHIARFALESGIRADAPAGRIIPTDPDALLYQVEAAYIAGLSPRTLESLRIKGGGPVFVALGRRAVRYRRRDLVIWIEAHRRRSTSDPGPAPPALESISRRRPEA